MAAATPPFLLLPGWQNSGPDHWQSRWERRYGDLRVAQHDWMRPLRGDWMSRLEEVLLEQTSPAILVAHSLGCLLVAAWAEHSRNTHLVRAAMLVAPPDTEQDDIPVEVRGWAPPPTSRLPFPAIVVASANDPFCSLPRARFFADSWGARFLDYGPHGHLNAQSGLDDWPQGRALLEQLAAGPN